MEEYLPQLDTLSLLFVIFKIWILRDLEALQIRLYDPLCSKGEAESCDVSTGGSLGAPSFPPLILQRKTRPDEGVSMDLKVQGVLALIQFHHICLIFLRTDRKGKT